MIDLRIPLALNALLRRPLDVKPVVLGIVLAFVSTSHSFDPRRRTKNGRRWRLPPLIDSCNQRPPTLDPLHDNGPCAESPSFACLKWNHH